jgi:hypothetical protein
MPDLRFWVWSPDDWQKHNGFKVDMERCRAPVYPSGEFTSYQCSRKVKVELEGYGWCTQHAKMIMDRNPRLQEKLDAQVVYSPGKLYPYPANKPHISGTYLVYVSDRAVPWYQIVKWNSKLEAWTHRGTRLFHEVTHFSILPIPEKP